MTNTFTQTTSEALTVNMLVKGGMPFAEAFEAVGYGEVEVSMPSFVGLPTGSEYKAMGREEREETRRLVMSLLEKCNNSVEHDEYWSTYHMYEAIEDMEYYHDNIKAFREFASHYGEPDFDYGFYSDWHKDIYGFRPR